MILVEERYPCGRHSKGRCLVYYKCRCDCGKEFVLTDDELVRDPYSCGCTPKPKARVEKGEEHVLHSFDQIVQEHSFASFLLESFFFVMCFYVY